MFNQCKDLDRWYKEQNQGHHEHEGDIDRTCHDIDRNIERGDDKDIDWGDRR